VSDDQCYARLDIAGRCHTFTQNNRLPLSVVSLALLTAKHRRIMSL
jgi:hypothetical protein